MLKTRSRHIGVIKPNINMTIIDLPTPINITMWWNFGRLLGVVLIIQITSGLFLAMHYTADIELAFSSVSHIVRDVNGGWFLRSIHANGASLFFICIYAHIGRGLYYRRYSYKGTWTSGVILLLLVMASAFLGYVLPWGQIRFWGATVITNLFRALPFIGEDLVKWIWGGFSVRNATLTRFYAIHFVRPMAVRAVVVIHIIILHSTGSNNPLGINSSGDKIPFHCYLTIKDLVGFIMMFFTILCLIIFAPNILGEPDNFIMANPISTPAHIVPEWYFLFAYAILRSVPNKLGGVVGIFAALALLLIIPILNKRTFKGNKFYPLRKILHWILLLSFLILTMGGSWPVDEPFVFTCQIFSLTYFSFFLLHFPIRLFSDKLMYYVEDWNHYVG